jgi:hypothetical protein
MKIKLLRATENSIRVSFGMGKIDPDGIVQLF